MMHCLFCEKPIQPDYMPGYGTYYTHTDGYRECQPTYASPNARFD